MAVRKEEVRVTADVSNFVTRFATAGRAADGFANRLEEADGRLAGLVQTGLALAPALAPIGAAAVPAIVGLTTQLGFAALAAGSTALAFQGVGDAVKALDTFKTTPTAENFNKLQIAMDKLGPAGQKFVLTLQQMRPEMQRLQSIAQQGLFPGVTDGMQELLDLMPQVERVLFTTTTTMGNLAREGAQNLAGPEFRDFFTYLQTTAGPVLTEMGRTLGHFIHGSAQLIMAFDPLSRDFSRGLLDVSRSFDEFAGSLDSTQGFQDFVDYVEKSGPAALDALGSIANALIQLVEAAAPVGTAVLPIISALADGLSAIADSPVGPLLISTAAAVGVLGRSLALLKIVGLRGGGDGVVAKALGASTIKDTVKSIREASAATKELTAAQHSANIERGLFLTNSAGPLGSQFLQSTDDYSAALVRQRKAEEAAQVATAKRSAAMRESGAQVGKAALAVGGLALATSGLADKTGLSNTASLALMGTIAGPLGSAVGAGVGAVMDLAAANNSLEDAMKKVELAARDSSGLVQQQFSIDALRAKTDQYNADLRDAWNPGGTRNPLTQFKQGWTALGDLVTNSGQEAARSVREQSTALLALKQGLADTYMYANNGDLSLSGPNTSLSELQGYAEKIAPALSAAGMSFDDLTRKPQAAAAAIDAYSRSQREAVTDSGAVADAMDYLSGQVVPKLTQATDLNSDGVINNTDAVLANIDAMKKRTDAIVSAFDAETAYQRALNEGKDRNKEKADLQQQIADAQATGAKRRAELRDRLAGATTDSERKGIRGQISDSFASQAKQVADLQARLDEYRNTLDKTTVAGQKNRDLLSDMAKGYNSLSDRQKNAKGRYEEASKALYDQAKAFGATDKQAQWFVDHLLQIPPRVQAEIVLKDQKAAAELKKFSDAFHGLDGKTAKAFVELRQKHMDKRLGDIGFSSGGYTGDGGVAEPAGIVHGREFVVNARATAANRALLEAINRGVPGYRNGGYVQPVGGGAVSLSDRDINRLAAAMAKARPLYGDVHVQDGTRFLQALEQDQRREAVGGFNFNG